MRNDIESKTFHIVFESDFRSHADRIVSGLCNMGALEENVKMHPVRDWLMMPLVSKRIASSTRVDSDAIVCVFNLPDTPFTTYHASAEYVTMIQGFQRVMLDTDVPVVSHNVADIVERGNATHTVWRTLDMVLS